MTWDWTFALEIVPTLLWGVWITILITTASCVIALIGGLALAIIADTTGWIGKTTIRLLIELLRGVPILVLLFFGFYALPQLGVILSPYVIGISVLGVVYAAYCSEVYRGALITIPSGMRDASVALGLSPFVTWTRILIPLAISKSIPALINYILLTYRQTAMLFAIGVPVLMSQAQILSYERFRYLEPYTLAGLIYILLNIPFIIILHKFNKEQ